MILIKKIIRFEGMPQGTRDNPPSVSNLYVNPLLMSLRYTSQRGILESCCISEPETTAGAASFMDRTKVGHASSP